MTHLSSSENHFWSALQRHIGEQRMAPFRITGRQAVGGGCINSAWLIESSSQRYFVKLNEPGSLPMFEAEAEGLRELARHGSLRAPAPLCWGRAGPHAYLVLEYLDLSSPGASTWEAMGRGLASQHHHTQHRFGWKRDNTIGSTPQANRWHDDWPGFWREQRLEFQLRLAHRNGYRGSLQSSGNKLLNLLENFFPGYLPAASLLHGDLWSGNCGSDSGGNPVIFDPAVYYGDRECDLAMTELFGAFPSRFHAAYEEAYPLDAGYRVRKHLYNLYHVLNHANMFGGSYVSQAENMIHRLLGEVV